MFLDGDTHAEERNYDSGGRVVKRPNHIKLDIFSVDRAIDG